MGNCTRSCNLVSLLHLSKKLICNVAKSNLAFVMHFLSARFQRFLLDHRQAQSVCRRDNRKSQRAAETNCLIKYNQFISVCKCLSPYTVGMLVVPKWCSMRRRLSTPCALSPHLQSQSVCWLSVLFDCLCLGLSQSQLFS